MAGREVALPLASVRARAVLRGLLPLQEFVRVRELRLAEQMATLLSLGRLRGVGRGLALRGHCRRRLSRIGFRLVRDKRTRMLPEIVRRWRSPTRPFAVLGTFAVAAVWRWIVRRRWSLTHPFAVQRRLSDPRLRIARRWWLPLPRDACPLVFRSRRCRLFHRG